MVPDAVKVSAEDGRRVEAVDISPYINNLPGGTSTSAFCSDDASGSTSQAASIQASASGGATSRYGMVSWAEETEATSTSGHLGAVTVGVCCRSSIKFSREESIRLQLLSVRHGTPHFANKLH